MNKKNLQLTVSNACNDRKCGFPFPPPGVSAPLVSVFLLPVIPPTPMAQEWGFAPCLILPGLWILLPIL